MISMHLAAAALLAAASPLDHVVDWRHHLRAMVGV
jgi:hypothetical protein